jgi:hypothetical protein
MTIHSGSMLSPTATAAHIARWGLAGCHFVVKKEEIQPMFRQPYVKKGNTEITLLTLKLLFLN